MPFGFHVVEDVFDLAVGTDDERGPRDPFEDFAVHVFVFDHAEGIADLLVGIGEQGVGQVVLVLKLLLFVRAVGGDAKYDSASFLNLLVCVAEPARLFGSTRCVGLGKEKQDHRFAAEIFQRNFFSILIHRCEVGGFIIDLHGIFFSSPFIVIS